MRDVFEYMEAGHGWEDLREFLPVDSQDEGRATVQTGLRSGLRYLKALDAASRIMGPENDLEQIRDVFEDLRTR